MTQTNYLPLNNEQTILALLQKGYSFLEIPVSIKDVSKIEVEVPNFIEVIPHTEMLSDKELVVLSQFLKSAPAEIYGVHSSYFNN